MKIFAHWQRSCLKRALMAPWPESLRTRCRCASAVGAEYRYRSRWRWQICVTQLQNHVWITYELRAGPLLITSLVTNTPKTLGSLANECRIDSDQNVFDIICAGLDGIIDLWTIGWTFNWSFKSASWLTIPHCEALQSQTYQTYLSCYGVITTLYLLLP